MTAWRTLLASLLVLAAGSATLAAATDGLRAFTTESARRLQVREQPRVLPAVRLESAQGQLVDLERLRGRWLLVDFIYTRCSTYCSALGGEFAQLQDALADEIARGQVGLLSISFDPEHDTPRELAAYQARARDRGAGWLAARPLDDAGLRALERAFGVVVVADVRGGFEHNAALHVVDPQGRLVAVLDWDDPVQALQFVRQRLAR